MARRGGWPANLKHGVAIMTNSVSRTSFSNAQRFEAWLKEEGFSYEGTVNNVFAMISLVTYKSLKDDGIVFISYDMMTRTAIVIVRKCGSDIVGKSQET